MLRWDRLWERLWRKGGGRSISFGHLVWYALEKIRIAIDTLIMFSLSSTTLLTI